MDATLLSTLAAAALSLLFSYVPGLAARYRRLDGTHKRLVMLALLVLVSFGAYGLACSGLGAAFGLALTCDQPGASALVKALVLALIANQATFLIAPRPGSQAARRLPAEGFEAGDRGEENEWVQEGIR